MRIRQGALSLPALLAIVAACADRDVVSPTGREPTARATPPYGFAQQTYVDYVKPPSTAAAREVTTESSDYSLFYGGARWFAGGAVEYVIAGSQPITGANSAAATGVANVDAYLTTRSFTLRKTTSQTNPCTGTPNTIQWVSYDGPGNVLGATSFCYTLGTREIVGFSMILDRDEPWAIGSTPTTMDVENAVTHEFGHAAGLAHTGAPRAACLTMYPYASYGEIQKRTLGLGDKLGMQALYNSTDVSAGTCGS